MNALDATDVHFVTVTVERSEQPLNALDNMEVHPLAITVVRDVQSLKALFPNTTFAGLSKVARDLHPSKDESSVPFTIALILIVVKELQFLASPWPLMVVFPRIDRCSRPLMFSKIGPDSSVTVVGTSTRLTFFFTTSEEKASSSIPVMG